MRGRISLLSAAGLPFATALRFAGVLRFAAALVFASALRFAAALVFAAVLQFGAALPLAGSALAAPASALTAMDEAGYQKIVAAHKGKVLLVNFWATWCEPCRAEMPALVKMEARLKAKGFVFVTVSADEPEDERIAREFLTKAGVGGAGYLKRVKNDDKFIAGLEPKWSGALPAMFLYDKTGKRAKFVQGEADLKMLEAEIAKLLP